MSPFWPSMRVARRLIPMLGAAGLAAGCAGMPEIAGDPPMDMSSPAAARAAAALAQPGPYPTFAQIPEAPASAPTGPRAQSDAVAALVSLPPPTDATPGANAFAAQQRDRLAGATLPTQADIDATEAFAAAARARATMPSAR